MTSPYKPTIYDTRGPAGLLSEEDYSQEWGEEIKPAPNSNTQQWGLTQIQVFPDAIFEFSCKEIFPTSTLDLTVSYSSELDEPANRGGKYCIEACNDDFRQNHTDFPPISDVYTNSQATSCKWIFQLTDPGWYSFGYWYQPSQSDPISENKYWSYDVIVFPYEKMESFDSKEVKSIIEDVLSLYTAGEIGKRAIQKIHSFVQNREEVPETYEDTELSDFISDDKEDGPES